jgi:hypothetical protein
MPTWKLAVYPLDTSPAGVMSSEERLSAKIPSEALEIGFVPRPVAYAPCECTALLIDSGKASCVAFTDVPLMVTST